MDGRKEHFVLGRGKQFKGIPHFRLAAGTVILEKATNGKVLLGQQITPKYRSCEVPFAEENLEAWLTE